MGKIVFFAVYGNTTGLEKKKTRPMFKHDRVRKYFIRNVSQNGYPALSKRRLVPSVSVTA